MKEILKNYNSLSLQNQNRIRILMEFSLSDLERRVIEGVYLYGLQQKTLMLQLELPQYKISRLHTKGLQKMENLFILIMQLGITLNGE